MFMKKILFKNRLFFIKTAGLLLLALASNSSFVSAQNEPRYSRMASLEASSEMKAYQKDLQSGSPFTEKHQQLLLDEGLPQLFIDGNRLDRAQARQRLEKIFFDTIADSNAYRKATDLAVTRLTALGRSEQISINGSINAVLFLGELRDKQGQLLAAATQPLSEIVSDDSVTPAVRIAALAGFGKRIQELRVSSSENKQVKAASIASTLNTIMELPDKSMPPIGRDWMQGRALEYSRSMLQNLGDNPQELDGAVKSAVTILKNSNRPIDLRIRTVVFLSYSANAGITLPTKEILIAADELVKESLRDAYGIIQDKKFEEEITGLSDFGNGNPIEAEKNYLPITYFVRSSWRLVTLADSMTRLAQQLENDKEQYEDRAKLIRSYGVKLYEEPKDVSLTSAIEAFDPDSIAPVTDETKPDETKPEVPPTEATPKKLSPFKLQ